MPSTAWWYDRRAIYANHIDNVDGNVCFNLLITWAWISVSQIIIIAKNALPFSSKKSLIHSFASIVTIISFCLKSKIQMMSLIGYKNLIQSQTSSVLDFCFYILKNSIQNKIKWCFISQTNSSHWWFYLKQLSNNFWSMNHHHSSILLPTFLHISDSVKDGYVK